MRARKNIWPPEKTALLRSQQNGRLRLSDAERATLGRIVIAMGRKFLAEGRNSAKPGPIRPDRKLVAHKFDGSKARQRHREGNRGSGASGATHLRNGEREPDWGLRRMRGALVKSRVCDFDQTVGNVLDDTACPPAPEARANDPPWSVFIQTTGMLAGTDFSRRGANAARVDYYGCFSFLLRAAALISLDITLNGSGRG